MSLAFFSRRLLAGTYTAVGAREARPLVAQLHAGSRLQADTSNLGLLGSQDEDFGGDQQISVQRTFKTTKRNIRGSPKKLNMLAKQIRGLTLQEAINQMTVQKRRKGAVVKTVLTNGANLAEIEADLPLENLRVAEAHVGKGMSLKRIRFHGRGRHGIMTHKYAHLTVVLREMSEGERSRSAAKAESNKRFREEKFRKLKEQSSGFKQRYEERERARPSFDSIAQAFWGKQATQNASS